MPTHIGAHVPRSPRQDVIVVHHSFSHTSPPHIHPHRHSENVDSVAKRVVDSFPLFSRISNESYLILSRQVWVAGAAEPKPFDFFNVL